MGEPCVIENVCFVGSDKPVDIACPEVFEIGDDGLAQPIQEVTETLEKTASQARESCPVNAIDLE